MKRFRPPSCCSHISCRTKKTGASGAGSSGVTPALPKNGAVRIVLRDRVRSSETRYPIYLMPRIAGAAAIGSAEPLLCAAAAGKSLLPLLGADCRPRSPLGDASARLSAVCSAALQKYAPGTSRLTCCILAHMPPLPTSEPASKATASKAAAPTPLSGCASHLAARNTAAAHAPPAAATVVLPAGNDADPSIAARCRCCGIAGAQLMRRPPMRRGHYWPARGRIR